MNALMILAVVMVVPQATPAPASGKAPAPVKAAVHPAPDAAKLAAEYQDGIHKQVKKRRAARVRKARLRSTELRRQEAFHAAMLAQAPDMPFWIAGPGPVVDDRPLVEKPQSRPERDDDDRPTYTLRANAPGRSESPQLQVLFQQIALQREAMAQQAYAAQQFPMAQQILAAQQFQNAQAYPNHGFAQIMTPSAPVSAPQFHSSQGRMSHDNGNSSGTGSSRGDHASHAVLEVLRVGHR